MPSLCPRVPMQFLRGDEGAALLAAAPAPAAAPVRDKGSQKFLTYLHDRSNRARWQAGGIVDMAGWRLTAAAEWQQLSDDEKERWAEHARSGATAVTGG